MWEKQKAKYLFVWFLSTHHMLSEQKYSVWRFLQSYEFNRVDAKSSSSSILLQVKTIWNYVPLFSVQTFFQRSYSNQFFLTCVPSQDQTTFSFNLLCLLFKNCDVRVKKQFCVASQSKWKIYFIPPAEWYILAAI